jgi:hypothetical protein
LYQIDINEDVEIRDYDTEKEMRGKYFTLKWVGDRLQNTPNPELIEIEMEVMQTEPQPKKGTYKK